MPDGGFDFLRDLSESRLFPMRRSLSDHAPRRLAELLYLYLIVLRVMLAEPETKVWAQHYCEQTVRGSNFKRWRSDGTDLYVLLHALTSDEEALHGDNGEIRVYRERIGLQARMIYQWLVMGSHARAAEQETRSLFSRLDAMCRIIDSSLRAVRRLGQDWPKLDRHQRRLLVTRLLQMLRHRASKGDFLPRLHQLALDQHLELSDVCDVDVRRAADEGAGSLLRSLAGRKATYENATSGSTNSANVAVLPGGIGAGFDDDYSKSIYPPPERRGPRVIRRQSSEDAAPIKASRNIGVIGR